MNTMLTVGVVGFVAALLTNLLLLLAFSWLGITNPAATFFTTDWWISWFPNYTVWCVFAIIGIAQKFSRESTNDHPSHADL